MQQGAFSYATSRRWATCSAPKHQVQEPRANFLYHSTYHPEIHELNEDCRRGLKNLSGQAPAVCASGFPPRPGAGVD